MKVLFITRKYPPAKGGMETLSYHLTTRYEGEKKILALRKKNQMHLVWFLPYCLVYLLFRGGQYDLVHLSDLVLIKLGWWVKLINKKTKVVINVHGLDINFVERKSILGKIYRFYLHFFKKEKNYDLLICNSKNTAEICKQYQFSKTTVIPIGVEISPIPEIFTKDDLIKIIGPEHRDKKYLVTVGRLIKRKGVNWFIGNVLPLLSEEIIYLVIGETNWLKREELDLIKETIRKKSLDKRVVLLGKISDRDLEVVYQTADLLIMPNVSVLGDSEGFGIVALEAASRGLPVVAANLEGITEAIKDDQNGFLVPSENAFAFKEKIELLLKQKDTSLREKIRKFTINNYSWEVVIKKYELSFDELWPEKK